MACGANSNHRVSHLMRTKIPRDRGSSSVQKYKAEMKWCECVTQTKCNYIILWNKGPHQYNSNHRLSRRIRTRTPRDPGSSSVQQYKAATYWSECVMETKCGYNLSGMKIPTKLLLSWFQLLKQDILMALSRWRQLLGCFGCTSTAINCGSRKMATGIFHRGIADYNNK